MTTLDSSVAEPAGTRGCATLPDLEDAIQAARDSLAQVPACP
jgi:hypothetical protein